MSGAGGLRRLPAGTASAPRVDPEGALAQAWSALEEARVAERREAVEVAFALAARVLSACGAHERVVAVEGLRAALDRLDPADVCLARVHPTDLAPCEAEVAGARAQVRVVADETLSPGDVVLEGRLGFLDARLAARLAALRASLELGR